MIEGSGADYQSSKFAKALSVSEPKVGKTTYLVATALGVFPGQKEGGIVTRPEDLHVFTFDANALGGIQRFLLETCGAPKEALNFRVYNMQDDFRKVADSEADYNMSFYNSVVATVQKARDRAKGSSVALFSSLTGLANGLERAIVGGPTGKGYSDPSKWKALAHQLHEIQNWAQIDAWHCIWEGHVDKPAGMQVGKETPGAGPKESIRVSGEAGRSWAYNTEQVFRIRRLNGQSVEVDGKKTKCDQVYLDTKPSLDFLSNGRGFNEALDAKESDPTVAFRKLGLTVGHWGQK